MRLLFVSILMIGLPVLLQAQLPDSSAWRYGRGQLISNRAMNIFLSEAAGYQLSGPDDLTLYKNSAIVDAAAGTLSIYHSFFQASGKDERIRSFLSVGARADVADGYNAVSNGRPYNNRFGAQVKQTWIGKGSVSASEGQMKTMDALRAGILHTLIREMSVRTAAFEASLQDWDSAREVPGQDLAGAKRLAREKFRADLEAEYTFKFADQQAGALARTFDYSVMSFNWTSASLYIPVWPESFRTSPGAAHPYSTRHAYPLHANLSHTRLWEGSGFGRLYLTLSGDLTLNNTRDAYGLDKDSAADYTGNYKSFVTPAVGVRAAWLPADSHIGISFLLQRHFGDFDALNAVIGVPIVLIDKNAVPAVDFEFQIRFFDIGDRLPARQGKPGKTSIGLTVGVPFSKIAF